MPSSVPFRFVLTHAGISRKFFTLFQGRDGSLYIHPYRPEGQAWRIPGGNDTDSRERRLDFANFREPGFELHKISFHPSGYIHLTDRHNKRFRDGTKGPKFNEMTLPYALCVLVPCELHLLPRADGEKGMVVDLILPDNMGPFYAILSLTREDILAESSAIVNFILPLNDGRKLTIAVRAVGLGDGAMKINWPPFPFFLLRTEA